MIFLAFIIGLMFGMAMFYCGLRYDESFRNEIDRDISDYLAKKERGDVS